MITLEKLFDCPAVISLAKRRERLDAFRERFKAACKPYGVDFWTAFGFDGENLPVPTGWETSKGAFGACLAHLFAWARVMSDAGLEENDPLLIFEDDAIFCDDFVRKLERAARLVPDDWDLFYLGGEHLPSMKGSPTRLVADGEIQLLRCWNVNRLHAYAVRRGALNKLFPRLLKYATCAPKRFGLSGEETCFDYEIGRATEEGEVVAYAVMPWLCGQGGFGSDTYPEKKADSDRFWQLG